MLAEKWSSLLAWHSLEDGIRLRLRENLIPSFGFSVPLCLLSRLDVTAYVPRSFPAGVLDRPRLPEGVRDARRMFWLSEEEDRRGRGGRLGRK